MNSLIPLFTDSAWRCEQPPYKKNADFTIAEDGKSASIQTAANFGVGKFIVTVPVEGGKYYDLKASCKTELPECDHYVIFTQYTADGRTPIREHAKHAYRDGGYIHFSDNIDVAPEAVKMEIELWVKGKGAYGQWQLPTLTEAEPLPERRVRIAPIHMKWGQDIPCTEEAHFDAYMKSIDTVGQRGVDLIVLGEGMYTRGLTSDQSVRARVYTPKIMKALSEKAVQYNTYIIYNGTEEDDGNFYNASFVINRAGECMGTYRKTHITVGEYEEGITPGDAFPVFDTDFGRIGCVTCYDQFFPETVRTLARKGAEIICIPTAGDDHHACMALAMYYGVYLAVAGMNNENSFGWGATRVVDPLGKQLAHTDVNLEAAYAEVDLSKKVRRFWMSTGPALSDVHDDYRYEVNPHSFEKEI